ncbi:Deoxyribonuclease-2 [Holothuria leucospilota]|uniref:Deoxyribonuclease-2 n=1 Tax=Holothuria leucospilota TaxID=206669 RepID=A0A9Q1C5H9_HOLLE|nr:Deoxyribonuclease-2 [Holothuria leucospilota]
MRYSHFLTDERSIKRMMSLTTPSTILFVFTFLFGVLCVAGVRCKDMNGHDVDWYYVYKLPRISSHKNPLIKSGVAFFYLDNFQQTFQLSNTSMEDLSQPIAQTLQQIYNSPSKIAHVMYNDQPPGGREQIDWGHTKGVVAYDAKDGFWLMHTVPWFPRNDTYEWPEKAKHYGQTAVCVSLKSSEMETVAKQMQCTRPYVYSNHTTDLFHSVFENVVKGLFGKCPSGSQIVQLQSLGMQNFTHYAKSKTYGKDIYFDLIAQDLKSDLLVETWRRSTALPSNCSLPFHVNNIWALWFPSTAKFTYGKDHSKWAITSNERQIICMGDINRMSTQFKRGGGVLCSHLPSVWQQFNDTVADVEPCPSKEK